MEQNRLPDPWLGQPIVKATVALQNVGDGLSKAVATDRLVLLPGEYVDVVVRARVHRHVIQPLDDDDPGGPLTIAYVLKGTEKCTVVPTDNEALQALLEDQQRRTDEAMGRLRLVGADGQPTEEARAET